MTNSIAWKTAVSGNWSVNGNWNPAGPPTGDVVTIAIGGASYTSTIDQSFSVFSLIVNNASATVVEAAGASLTIAGGAIEVAAGVLNLTQANTISTDVFAYGGELDIGVAGALGTATLDILNCLVRGTSNETISNPITITLASSTQTIAAAHGTTLTLAPTTASYTGGNSLLKFGVAGSDGTVNVASANSWTVTNTNKIEVVAGTLTGNANGLGALTSGTASTTIDAGATIDMNGTGITIGALNGAGALTNSGGANLCLLQGGNFSGVISGSITLDLNGTITLSGANTYIGLTDFAAGVTTIANGSALSSGLLLFQGGSLVAGGNMTLGNNGRIFGNNTATIAVATGSSLNLTGTISFSTGYVEKLVFGGAGALGAVTFGAGGGIAGFAQSDIIDFANVAYAAGEKMVLMANANGIETFALENASNTVLTTINLVGYYPAFFLNVNNDGGGHAQISLSPSFFPAPPTVTQDFFGLPWSDALLQSGGTLVDYIIHNNAVAWGNLLSTSLAGWTVVGTGDYNGDGTSDILLQAGSTVVEYIMHGGLVQSGAVFGSTGGLQVVGK